MGSPVAALPGGLRAIIEPTAALVAIDMDMAAATAGREPKAAKQEARQPRRAAERWRAKSGFAICRAPFCWIWPGFPCAAGPASPSRCGAALASDPLNPRLLGFTVGGLAEIQRPRIHPPLHELLAGPHAAGLAALRRLAASADPASPPWLRAAPDVVSALEADGMALPALAHRLGRPLVLRSDPALPPGATVIEETARG